MHRTLAALDREWQQLIHSRNAALALERWRSVDPVMQEFVDLPEVVSVRRDRLRAQPVLVFLVRQARADEVAARVLLQALLPGLVRLAAGFSARHPDAVDDIVALAWERIVTYPTQRCGSVAANVLRDIRKTFVASHARCQVPARALSWSSADPAEEVALGRLCGLDALDAARRAGAITNAGFEVVVRSRLDDVPLAVLAAEQQVTWATVQQVRVRAEKRMRKILQGRNAA